MNPRVYSSFLCLLAASRCVQASASEETLQRIDGAPISVGNEETDQIASVPKLRILDFKILWDQECLFNHSFFGLRFGTDISYTIKFYYGSVREFATLRQGTMTALAEIPVRNGEIHGKVRRWSPAGKLMLEVPYTGGKIDGECRFYSYNGKLLGTSTLKNGTGTYRVWDASQDVPTHIRETEYVDGKIVSPNAAK